MCVIPRRLLDSKWPCNAKGIGTYSEKNARCGKIREKKKSEAKPTREGCV